MISPPRRWQNAARLIKDDFILPFLLKGGFYNTGQAFAGWCGDKFLGASAAKILSLELHGHKRTAGNATVLTSIALSNSFFASNIDTILPHLRTHQGVKNLNDHDIGTIVEAAVAKVSQENQDAVDDLARWLVQKAEDSGDTQATCSRFIQEQKAKETLAYLNAKGHLLNIGGKVYSKREGGPNHAPIFSATAEFHFTDKQEDYRTNSKARSKKSAERIAAVELLERLKSMTTNVDNSLPF